MLGWLWFVVGTAGLLGWERPLEAVGSGGVACSGHAGSAGWCSPGLCSLFSLNFSRICIKVLTLSCSLGLYLPPFPQPVWVHGAAQLSLRSAGLWCE